MARNPRDYLNWRSTLVPGARLYQWPRGMPRAAPGNSAAPAQPVSEDSNEPRPPGAAPVRARPLLVSLPGIPPDTVPQSIPTATVQEQVAEPAPPAQPVSEDSPEPRPSIAPVRARPLGWTMTHDIIRRLYPDGRVPQSVQTATVEKQVAALWREECKARGVPYFEPPSWDSIKRYLGR
jgi:hypothetical protein